MEFEAFIKPDEIVMGNGGGNFAMTLAEIGEELGLTRERVRQIQERALGKVFKKFCIMHPTLDKFEIMALLVMGFGLKGKPVEQFYQGFPDWVKEKVKKDAPKHAPYLKKELEGDVERNLVRKPLDKLGEVVYES